MESRTLDSDSQDPNCQTSFNTDGQWRSMVAIGSLETPCQVLSRWNGQERETSVPIARYDPEVEAQRALGRSSNAAQGACYHKLMKIFGILLSMFIVIPAGGVRTSNRNRISFGDRADADAHLRDRRRGRLPRSTRGTADSLPHPTGIPTGINAEQSSFLTVFSSCSPESF